MQWEAERAPDVGPDEGIYRVDLAHHRAVLDQQHVQDVQHHDRDLVAGPQNQCHAGGSYGAVWERCLLLLLTVYPALRRR